MFLVIFGCSTLLNTTLVNSCSIDIRLDVSGYFWLFYASKYYT